MYGTTVGIHCICKPINCFYTFAGKKKRSAFRTGELAQCNNHCSFRRPGTPTMGYSQLPVILALGDLIPSSGFYEYLHAQSAYAYTWHIHIQIKQIPKSFFFFFNMCLLPLVELPVPTVPKVQSCRIRVPFPASKVVVRVVQVKLPFPMQN